MQILEPTFYKLQAITRKQLRVSKHGIGYTKGGNIVDEIGWFHWRHDPDYLKIKSMQEMYPDCEIIKIWKTK
jgi:hypothetical protein